MDRCVLELTCHKWRPHDVPGAHLGGILVDFNEFHMLFSDGLEYVGDSLGLNVCVTNLVASCDRLRTSL